jgi:hypothetical protein
MRPIGFTVVLMAAIALAACSSDAPSPSEKNDGTTTYLNVAISMPSSASRGEVDDENFYAEGSEDEYAVDNALFYFYDANGNFLTEAKGVSDGEGSDNVNIDYRTQTMLILTNLDSDNLPKYMVTVLNRPVGFTGSLLSLDEMLNQINTKFKTVYGKFVMTTSSYSHGYSNGERIPYHVTELSDDMFYSTLAAATAENAKAVDVYVERLASKVQVSLSSSLISSTNTKVITAADGSKRYIHKVSGINVNGKNQLQDFYVELLNWGLNGKMQVSYLFKHINESWTNEGLGFTWNNPTDCRSYWGMSYNYNGQGHDYAYPTKYQEGELEGDTLSELQYISANEISRPFEGENYGYCMENTNTMETVKAAYPNCLTSVLVLARIVDENGDPLKENLVYFMNKFYTETEYINMAIEQLAQQNNGGTSVKFDTDDFELADQGNGEVFIALSSKGESTLASNDEELVAAINAGLRTFNETAVANAYRDGYMYYNIPIQHRNGNGITSKNDIKEATFGVVRNHWYQIAINNVLTLGKGINNPDEPIIVNDKDQQFYYIGANVNILSWAKVSQKSDL